MQDYKYQMRNKFSSIDNVSHKQKKYNEFRGEIYLITTSDAIWTKWKSVFEKHETGDLINPDTGMLFNRTTRFKQMKPLIRMFFRTPQGLSKTDMGKAASHIMHIEPSAKRWWVHPKIVFQKPKSIVPSCYTMKEWTKIRKEKTIIVQELHKLVPDKNIFVNGEVNEAQWRAFKEEYKFTSTLMTAFIREAREDFLRSKLVKGGKNWELLEHSARAVSNFIKEKKIVHFEGDEHFNLVILKPLKIQGWPGVDARKEIRTRARDRFPFGMIDFRNNPGSSFEGTMSTLFHEPFMSKFADYASTKLREIDIWLWIVEDRRAK